MNANTLQQSANTAGRPRNFLRAAPNTILVHAVLLLGVLIAIFPIYSMSHLAEIVTGALIASSRCRLPRGGVTTPSF